MEDVRNQMEAQSEEAAQLKRAKAGVRKTRSGNMRGSIQALTGEGVAEGGASASVHRQSGRCARLRDSCAFFCCEQRQVPTVALRGVAVLDKVVDVPGDAVALWRFFFFFISHFFFVLLALFAEAS